MMVLDWLIVRQIFLNTRLHLTAEFVYELLVLLVISEGFKAEFATEIDLVALWLTLLPLPVGSCGHHTPTRWV